MNAVSILGVVAAFSVLFLAAIIWYARKGFLPCRRELKKFGLLSAIEKFLIALFVGGWMVFGGSKNDPANSPPLGMMGPPMTMVGQSPNVVITEAETNAGYRVESVIEGDGIVSLVNATTNDLWRLRGGMVDARRMENGKWKAANSSGDDSGPHWYFPYRDTFTEGLTVFANGEFRPNVKTTYFPRPFDAVLSLVPQGKWGQIANGGPSIFTHELTPSNSLMLSWQNALYNRDANCPTNFQAELFADGRFEYRYPGHTTRYAPVFSFDWDGDGLENSVDPEPMVAGRDAHGTNVEWYNNVCSNVYSAMEVDGEIVLSPRNSSVNTNAYYFVDVVAERGPTPIYFMADGESRLGNPVIVARAGETNHVPLLIGADYCMSSSVPVSISAPVNVQIVPTYAMDSHDNVWTPVDHIRWPSGLRYVQEGGAYVAVVDDAERLGGIFKWMGGCCLHLEGTNLAFSCHSCGCGGCSTTLNYTYEWYTGSVAGPSCGCTGNADLPESIPYVQTTSGARVELGFDKKAVIFEHAYDNTPTNHVPLRSTAVVLTLRANGGIHGGTLAVTTSRLSRLGIVDGDRPITGSTNLAPYQVYEMVSTNHGALASTMVNDIEVTAEFMENDSDETVRVHTALTAYELKLSAEYVAPENPTCTNRHIYGVGEKVRFRVMPKSSIVSLHTVLQDMGDETFSYETFDANPTNGVLEVHADLDHVYTCPISKNYQPDIKVQAYDVEYVPIISLVEPSQVITTGAMWGDNAVDIFYVGNVKCWPYGEVGTAALVTTNYIGPMNVSFKGIAVSEVPCEDLDIVSGCFTNTPTEFQSHTRDAGAGKAHNIKDGNFWFVDGARSRSYVHNWTPNSTNSWLIPIGWHRLQYDVNSLGEEYDSHEVYDYDFETRWSESTRRLQVGATSDIIKQVVTIDGDGTCRTEKFGHWISRTRWCRVTLDGTVLQKSYHEQDR